MPTVYAHLKLSLNCPPIWATNKCNRLVRRLIRLCRWLANLWGGDEKNPCWLGYHIGSLVDDDSSEIEALLLPLRFTSSALILICKLARVTSRSKRANHSASRGILDRGLRNFYWRTGWVSITRSLQAVTLTQSSILNII